MTNTATPEIIELVREFRAGGGFYDDDAVAFVAGRLEREPSRELSRACYDAKTTLSDETAQAEIDDLIDSGYVFVRDAEIVNGGRYEFRRGTVYVGREVASYGDAATCRAVFVDGQPCLLPGRNRTHGFRPQTFDLIRPV